MIIGTTDLHLTDLKLDDYRFEFIEKHFIDEIRNSKAAVDGVVILGDLTEEKDRHSARLVNRVVNALDAISRLAPTLILMGNHDYHDEGHPFFGFVSHIENLRFIDSVTEGRKLGAPFSKAFGHYLFLPHTRNYKAEWASYIKNGWGDYDCIFAHNTFDGADTGYGRKLEGIPAEIFKGHQVIAGDVHNPQKVGPVEYIGAPYTVDFGDDYDPRLLLLKEDQVRWRSVGHLPQKTLIHVHPGKDLMDYKSKIGSGDILKVRVDVDDMTAWNAIVNIVHAQAKKLGARAERVEPVIANRTKRASTKVQSGESAISDKEILMQFADRHRLDDDTLDEGLDLLEDKDSGK